MPSVADMNYRNHLHVPSAVHIEVSVADHPEYRRVIELPEDSPEEWLAHAYLLSVGVEPSDDDIEGFAYRHRNRDAYDCHRWTEYDTWPEVQFVAGGSAFVQGRTHVDDEQPVRLPSFPHDLDIMVNRAPHPTVGDAKVSIVGSGESRPTHPDLDWHTSRPPLMVEQVNHELARRYGVVLPSFSSRSLRAVDDRIRARSLLADLLGALTPLRRIALRAHLEGGGLLDASTRDIDMIRAATQALRSLIDAIGPDGVDQDADGGWLPAALVERVIAGLEWNDDPANAATTLVSMARRARLVRRLRGRIVVTAAGRQLMVDPVKAFPQILDAVTSAGGHSYASDASRFEAAAATLALADGSAGAFDELAAFVEKAHSARDTRAHDE